MANTKRIIEEVYSQRNNGRLLNWLLNRGVSRLEGKLKANYKFTLSNLMTIILLHIDESPGKRMQYIDLKLKFKPKKVRSREEEEQSGFYREFHINILTLV